MYEWESTGKCREGGGGQTVFFSGVFLPVRFAESNKLFPAIACGPAYKTSN